MDMEVLPSAVTTTQHVAVLGFPFGSHAGPLLSLVRRIAAAAPQVTFSFFTTAKSKASIFFDGDKEELRNLHSYNVHDGLPEGYVPSGNPIEPINLFIKAMPGNYRHAMEEVVANTGKITCLVTDAFLWFGGEIAEEMHAKWVPLWTAGLHSLLAHVYTDVIRQRIGSNDVCDDQNIDFLPGFSHVKVADLPEGIVTGIEEPFSIMVHKMGQMLPRANAVVINSFAGLNPLIENELKSKFQMLMNIGPFTLTTPQPIIMDEHGCLDWLDKHEKSSVAYICFGSEITPSPHELTALAEALEESRLPFIWSFRGNTERQLPRGFLERTRTKGKVVSWAPQIEILKHASVGVCVTHCGWNSILESIVGGVPMICRPFFGDQKLNTRMLESVWGIGIAVENGVFTKNATLKALESILSSEKGKIMRQKIVALNESAMKAVEPTGSSTVNFRTLIKLVTTSN